MRRPRSRPTVIGLAFLYLILAAFVQFAPSIHALSPHDHEGTTCKHGPTGIHFESDGENNDAPCPVCAHLAGRPVFLFSMGLRLDDLRAVQSSPAVIDVHSRPSVLHLPDSRGPPPAL
jgi:hypothetical protein